MDGKAIRQRFKSEAEKFSQHSAQATLLSEDEEDFTQNIYMKRKISNVESEIEQYFKEDNLEKTEDPLDYWKMKIKSYPSLNKMAMTYLAVPSTSTPAERAFSKG